MAFNTRYTGLPYSSGCSVSGFPSVELKLSLLPLTISQSPEIAEIRRKTQPALRHSGLPRSPKQLREDNTEVTNNFGVGGGQNLTGSFEGCVGSNSAENQSNATSPQHRKGRMARVGNRQGCSESDHTALPVLASSGGGGGCSESTLDVADRSEMPKVTPCTSDIWAWALIVLQMFSDDVWPSGSGQVCCL